jgi:predicted phosphoribosyltransferase
MVNLTKDGVATGLSLIAAGCQLLKQECENREHTYHVKAVI